jgi:hypothetical protein
MDRTFSPAIEHIRVMESRTTKQEGAIERLRILGKDSSDAEQRLRLLRAAFEEMRIQLAQLTPTHRRASRGTGMGIAFVSATTEESSATA